MNEWMNERTMCVCFHSFYFKTLHSDKFTFFFLFYILMCCVFHWNWKLRLHTYAGVLCVSHFSCWLLPSWPVLPLHTRHYNICAEMLCIHTIKIISSTAINNRSHHIASIVMHQFKFRMWEKKNLHRRDNNDILLLISRLRFWVNNFDLWINHQFVYLYVCNVSRDELCDELLLSNWFRGSVG